MDEAKELATAGPPTDRVSRDHFEETGDRTLLAEVLVIGGEYDAAIDQLEYLLTVPSATSVAQLELDPIWNPLRDQPRFKRLLERHRTQ
ncbi:MAG: hypothetical protein AMS21_12725 [Gemmatimonas sp. SG8_38_2]|nr:MAG: hypothetical protein AMS21_12725 [Gemmatimonas sp. SG8_38_2]